MRVLVGLGFSISFILANFDVANAENPSSPPKYYYLLSKPLSTTVQLGPIAKGIHYFGETGFQFAKAAAIGYATNHYWIAGGLLLQDLIRTPPTITAQSLVDLEF